MGDAGSGRPEIREARPGHGDAAALRGLVRRNREDLNIAAHEVERRADELCASIGRDIVLLALAGEDPVGFCIVHTTPNLSTWHVGSVRLLVDTEHWNRGIGSSLLDEAVSSAGSRALVRLEALPYAPLDPWKYHLFVDKAGFELEGVRRAAAFKDGDFRDVLVLAKLLPRPDDAELAARKALERRGGDFVALSH